MTRAKKHKVKYPLATKLVSGPQTPVAQAVQRAEKNVEALHDDLVGAVDVEIANVQREAESVAPGNLTGLYESADRLMAIASACRLRGLSEAAHGLCDLLEQVRTGGKWDPEGVAVHVASLRLLRHETSVEAAKAVLGGLMKVRQKLSPPG